MNKKAGREQLDRLIGLHKKLVELQAKLTTKTLANKVTRMIIMIAAAAENNALGKNNELVWHLQMILSGLKP
jgi:dihydrofolate reductase